MEAVPSKPRILLVDNSNTRTKFALFADGECSSPPASLPTAELSVEGIRHLLCERGWRCERSLICSVVPAAARILEEALGGDVHFLGASSPMSLTLDYPRPETLGADRLANVIAAARFAPLPCVVADFGTAVTFDVLVAGEGGARFIGGVIAPGLGAMGQYLGRNAALLPALEAERPAHAIGRSTEEALHAGSFHGYCGLVRGILEGITGELGERPHVIATGGDAALLGQWLPEIDCVSPSLTFAGLALVAEALHGEPG